MSSAASLATKAAVILLYGIAAFLVSSALAWLGALVALPSSRKPPPLLWVERARLAYPPRRVTAVNLFLLPLLLTVFLYAFAEENRLPLPTGAGAATVLGALIGGFWIRFRTERRIRWGKLTAKDWLRSLTTALVASAPVLATLIIVPIVEPDQLNREAIGILILGALLLALGVSGGGYLLARAVGLIRPASPRLTAVVAAVAARNGTPPPPVYEVRMSISNAFALPLYGVAVVTERMLEILNDDELSAIVSHELAHLSESRLVGALRMAGSLALLCSIIAARPVIGTFGQQSILTLLILWLVSVVFSRRLARRMEVRADAIGKSQEASAGVYAQALEKLYADNLIPAVMPQRRRVHPDLYDRLIAAGVTPAYPKPKPPASGRTVLAVLVAVLTAGFLLVVAAVVHGVFWRW